MTFDEWNLQRDIVFGDGSITEKIMRECWQAARRAALTEAVEYVENGCGGWVNRDYKYWAADAFREHFELERARDGQE